MAKKEPIKKTNVMRILDQHKIPYEFHTYNPSIIDGISVAKIQGQDLNQVFKTLVTQGKSKEYYIFLIPVNKELDLKKAADTVNEKYINMIKAKELLPLTGYVHGGCSPIGMKKQFRTIIDISATNFDTIIFSAGRIGFQIEISLNNLSNLLDYSLETLTEA